MLTVTAAAEFPVTFAGSGDTAQVEPEGAPLHARFTAPLNPSAPLMLRLYVAVCPA